LLNGRGLDPEFWFGPGEKAVWGVGRLIPSLHFLLLVHHAFAVGAEPGMTVMKLPLVLLLLLDARAHERGG